MIHGELDTVTGEVTAGVGGFTGIGSCVAAQERVDVEAG